MIISFRKADLLDMINKEPATYYIKFKYDESEMPMSRFYFDELQLTDDTNDQGRFDYLMNLIPELLEEAKQGQNDIRNVDEAWNLVGIIYRRLKQQGGIKKVNMLHSNQPETWIIEVILE